MTFWSHNKEFTEQDFDEWLGPSDIKKQKRAYFNGLLEEEGLGPSTVYYHNVKHRHNKDKPTTIEICPTREAYEQYTAIRQAHSDAYSAALDAVKHFGEWSKEDMEVRRKFAPMCKQVEADAKVTTGWTERPVTDYQLDIIDAIDSLVWSTRCHNTELLAKVPKFEPRYKFKDAKEIYVSDMCMSSLPCSHSITVEMQDGTKVSGWADGVSIYKMFMLLKGECTHSHIKRYGRYNGHGGFDGEDSEGDD